MGSLCLCPFRGDLAASRQVAEDEVGADVETHGGAGADEHAVHFTG